MTDSRADLLLHPVRMRIVLAMAGRQLTAADLAAALPDVPQATLYRHLNRLAEGGILTVVAENPVRGLVQKVYALARADVAQVTAAEAAAISADDFRQLFAAFATTLVASFEQYLASTDRFDPVADGVGFHIHPVYLSDAELMQFAQRLAEAIGPLLANTPGPERRRRLLATVLMPAAEP